MNSFVGISKSGKIKLLEVKALVAPEQGHSNDWEETPGNF